MLIPEPIERPKQTDFNQANDSEVFAFFEHAETPLSRSAFSRQVVIKSKSKSSEEVLEISAEGVSSTFFYFERNLPPNPWELGQAVELVEALCLHGRKLHRSEYTGEGILFDEPILDSRALVSLVASLSGLHRRSPAADRLITAAKNERRS